MPAAFFTGKVARISKTSFGVERMEVKDSVLMGSCEMSGEELILEREDWSAKKVFSTSALSDALVTMREVSGWMRSGIGERWLFPVKDLAKLQKLVEWCTADDHKPR